MQSTSLDPIIQLMQTWTGYGQVFAASAAVLALVAAFIWRMIALEPRAVMESKRWIQRIVVGVVGVELAGTLVHIMLSSLPSHP